MSSSTQNLSSTTLHHTDVNRVGFGDLSGKDKAKIIGITVAKVAIPIILGVAIVAAAWFLAPIAIPAGILLFGGYMAGFAGGGALLATIEGAAFKGLNILEDNIYSKYQQKSKNEITKETQVNDQEEIIKAIQEKEKRTGELSSVRAKFQQLLSKEEFLRGASESDTDTMGEPIEGYSRDIDKIQSVKEYIQKLEDYQKKGINLLADEHAFLTTCMKTDNKRLLGITE